MRMELDPEDPRPPYQQVANALRASILTKTFQPGEKLPSGSELARRYGVARMTAQQAIRLLRDEGLVVSRQGSGVYVRERTARPVGLRPHLESAMEEAHIAIDFAGFSGETLHGAITEPLDKLRVGRLRPESLRLRILVPDPREPWTLPARADDLSDSPAFRERANGIMTRHTTAVVDAVNELGELGIVPDAYAEIRSFPGVPFFKLYVINGREAFYGYYPVTHHVVELEGEKVPMWDLMGKDATLFHYADDGDQESTQTQFVAQSKMWFESLWSNVAKGMQH